MRIFQPIVTGSLNVTGSVTATSFTGSLFGTASWANNVLNTVSASHAATASSADAFTVRNNLIVSGNVALGDTSTDTITLTATTMSLGSGNGILNIDSNTLYVDGAANRVGIGTISPGVQLDVSGDMRASGNTFTSHIVTNIIRANTRDLVFQSGSAGNTVVATMFSSSGNFVFEPSQSGITIRDLGYRIAINGPSTSGSLFVSGATVLNGNLIVSGNMTFGDATTDSIVMNAATMSLLGNLNIDSNTLFVDGGANRVGIGVNSPDTRLEVSGSTFSTNVLRVTTADSQTDLTDLTLGSTISTYNRATTLNTFSLFSFAHGNGPTAVARLGSRLITLGGGTGLYTGDFFIQVRNGSSILDTALYIRANTNVGISTTTPNYKLDVSGSGNFTNGLTVTGSLLAANITGSLLGSSSYALTASYAMNAGGGSVDTSGLVTTSSFNAYTGSNTSQFAGTASFAQTASLVTGTVINAINAQSGSNFVVTSTLTIDETLTDFSKYASTIVGSNNMFQQATGSWTSAHCRYTVYKGANSRAGEFVVSWNGTSTSYYDNATVDIGNTSDITFQAAIVSSQIQINAVAASSAWTVKMIATYL